MKNTNDYYDMTAESYDEWHGGSNEHNLALEYLKLFMKHHNFKTLLDVGAGTGRAVKALHLEGYDCKAVEPSEAMIKVAIKNGVPSDILIQGYGESLPFADNSFDAVCEFGMLHHVPVPAEVVAEMLRVSKSAVFISDTNRFGRASVFQRLAKFALWKSGLWQVFYRLYKGGKGCDISDCDGIAYSYSVYDNHDQIAKWADRIILIPTKVEGTPCHSWFHPLFTASHVLVCAFRERRE
jgi:ubiquinone/menaquinone biosynthesis C-methylase UbiE